MTFLWGVGWQKFFSPEFVSLAQPRRTLQNPKKVFVRVKFVFLRRFNQTVDHGAGLCTTGRIGTEPVLPAHHKGLNAALGTVVAQLQTAILQINRNICGGKSTLNPTSPNTEASDEAGFPSDAQPYRAAADAAALTPTIFRNFLRLISYLSLFSITFFYT